MGTQHYEVPVYTIAAFDKSAPAFWMCELANLYQGYSFMDKPFRQNFYSILYLQEGKGMAETDEQSVMLQNNHVFCCAPNSINSLQLENGAKGFLVVFTDAFYSLRYHNNILNRFAFFQTGEQHLFSLPTLLSVKWQELLAFMWHEFLHKPKNEQMVLRSYLNILLQDTERLEHERADFSIFAPSEKIGLFVSLLETAYREQKSPSFYAGKLFITTHYLNKLCKIYKGLTSSQLIQERVITEAKRLLLHTQQTVSEIAYELGFESLSYFITFFKKKTGYTPERYRKKNF